MSRRVVVVGAGASGSAAAWAAAAAGATVIVVCDRAGASELASGAVDDALDVAAAESPLEPEIAAFAAALGLWRLGGVRLATPAGVVRAARGCDFALLDLAPLAGGRVAVADLGGPSPDARLLARGLAEGAWARATGTRFEGVPVNPPRALREALGSEHELARALERAPSREGLVDALTAASRAPDGWLLGPGLGLTPATALALRAALGKPVGEVTSRPGGLAGARFGRARDALLSELGVQRIRGRVRSVTARTGGQSVTVEVPSDGGRTSIEADAVVLAVGGLVAGGLELAAAAPGAPAFRLGLDAEVALALGGRPLDAVASLDGADLVALGRSALERVGVDVLVRGRVRSLGSLPSAGAAGPPLAAITPDQSRDLWAAGGCVADRPRTLLDAVRTGIVAGGDAGRV